MTTIPIESPFITSKSFVIRPFYVVVDQVLQSHDASCLDLNEGDIFLVTRYNKIGYWWGVSVYDSERQGWFPSTFTQPYTGEVPEEIESLCLKIRTNPAKEDIQDIESDEVSSKEEPQKEYNIVTQDVFPFQEYQSSLVVSKRGRDVRPADQGIIPPPDDEEDTEEITFDYDTWADAKNETVKKVEAKRRKT
jgi:hypothetical protein